MANFFHKGSLRNRIYRKYNLGHLGSYLLGFGRQAVSYRHPLSFFSKKITVSVVNAFP
jgi:hypothetical protein